MKKYIPLFLLTVIIAACNRSKHSVQGQHKTIHQIKPKDSINSKPKLLEFDADSTTIGRKNLNKVEISMYAIADSNYVVIDFFSKQGGRWVLKSNFNFPKDGTASVDMEASDFDNDGLNDMTYVSAIAARGANEIRSLFIYNKEKDCLTYIKNSSDYPNIKYNKKLNCIDAWLIYRCNETVFLKLEADTLREFASVEQCDSLTVSVYDKKGNQKVIQKKETNHDDFIRFKNYRPLEENNDPDR